MSFKEEENMVLPNETIAKVIDIIHWMKENDMHDGESLEILIKVIALYLE